VVELVELRGLYPKNGRALSRLYVWLFVPLSNLQPNGRGELELELIQTQMAQKPIFRIAETNLDALNTVDLGPKRPFGVGECALWARLTGPQFAAQVAAAVSLVQAAVNY
jgi:hypothetical protein